jgi:hypothetical protein
MNRWIVIVAGTLAIAELHPLPSFAGSQFAGSQPRAAQIQLINDETTDVKIHPQLSDMIGYWCGIIGLDISDSSFYAFHNGRSTFFNISEVKVDGSTISLILSQAGAPTLHMDFQIDAKGDVLKQDDDKFDKCDKDKARHR